MMLSFGCQLDQIWDQAKTQVPGPVCKTGLTEVKILPPGSPVVSGGGGHRGWGPYLRLAVEGACPAAATLADITTYFFGLPV